MADFPIPGIPPHQYKDTRNKKKDNNDTPSEKKCRITITK